MEELKVGDLCKHFKGKSLVEKNIYEILEIGVVYTGEKAKEKIDNLVIYKNIFQKGKIFAREYDDLVAKLDQEKQLEFSQEYRVQKLTTEEIEMIKSEQFKKEKLAYMKKEK